MSLIDGNNKNTADKLGTFKYGLFVVLKFPKRFYLSI